MRTSTRVAVFAATLLALGTTAAAPATATTTTGTPARQLAWLADASRRLPVSDTELRQHIDATMLTGLGGPAKVNQTLAQFAPLTVGKTLRSTSDSVQALVTDRTQTYVAKVTVDSAGLLSGLHFTPYLAAPTSWSAVDTQLAALAPNASMASTEIDKHGRCHPVHGVNADTAHPLGSAFKLYVLGALADAVAAHTASWDEKLAIRDDWKSLPSGQLQNEPAGTELTLRTYADYMISISDNTATDHLIHRLGRPAVEAELAKLGNADPAADMPFLTTREMFAMKGHDYPTLANRYVAASADQRRAMLPELDAVPRTEITGWKNPENLDTIEWFGSPNDICRAYAGLWQRSRTHGLAPVGQALSLDDEGVGLPQSGYPDVWYKGGSEPGVLTMNFLAHTRDGRTFVTSVMLTDTAHPFDEATVVPKILALVRGGFTLAAAGHRH